MGAGAHHSRHAAPRQSFLMQQNPLMQQRDSWLASKGGRAMAAAAALRCGGRPPAQALCPLHQRRGHRRRRLRHWIVPGAAVMRPARAAAGGRGERIDAAAALPSSPPSDAIWQLQTGVVTRTVYRRWPEGHAVRGRTKWGQDRGAAASCHGCMRGAMVHIQGSPGRACLIVRSSDSFRLVEAGG